MEQLSRKFINSNVTWFIIGLIIGLATTVTYKGETVIKSVIG